MQTDRTDTQTHTDAYTNGNTRQHAQQERLGYTNLVPDAGSSLLNNGPGV